MRRERLFRRAARAASVGVAATLICAGPSFSAPPAAVAPDGQEAIAIRNKPEVYLLRGFADIFSDGLNQMGQTLEAQGVDVHVQNHMTWQSVARRIIRDQEENGASRVVLVGHSLGANAVIMIAEMLQRRGIAVDQLVTLAATDPRPVPSNVRRAVNYYFETNGWGRPLAPGLGFRGTLVNKDYSGSAEIGHFNIDKQRSVQAEILSLVSSVLHR